METEELAHLLTGKESILPSLLPSLMNLINRRRFLGLDWERNISLLNSNNNIIIIISPRGWKNPFVSSKDTDDVRRGNGHVENLYQGRLEGKELISFDRRERERESDEESRFVKISERRDAVLIELKSD